MLELGEDFRTHWFPLIGEEQNDLNFQVDLSQPHLAPTAMDGLALQTVELVDLGDGVEDARVLPWSDVIEAIRSVRLPNRRTSYGDFFGEAVSTPLRMSSCLNGAPCARDAGDPCGGLVPIAIAVGGLCRPS